MNENTFTAASGTSYTFTLNRKSRVAYGEFMNLSTVYEEVYYQVDVYRADQPNTRVNFGFVDNPNDIISIHQVIEDVDQWVNTSDRVLASMHSTFD